MAKKFYVVWTGRQPGVYSDWASAEAQIKGFEGARFKGFASQAEAEEAYAHKPKPLPAYLTKPAIKPEVPAEKLYTLLIFSYPPQSYVISLILSDTFVL